MDMQLPAPIAAYFEADRRGNADAVAACFSDDAVVTDERRTHTGREAIRRWTADASATVSYMVAPFAIGMDGNRMVVTSQVSGTFPGSPIDLRYVFTVEGGKIAALEIVP
ncbi:nuclear transport factor 2 family protein [Tistrella bauzanensis]|uniref:Nuclear transport factor 2 family protein n=1 Tax=Tistrella arctica TaxID=3133430 RepID=A0ABU9YKL1_9PROT